MGGKVVVINKEATEHKDRDLANTGNLTPVTQIFFTMKALPKLKTLN
jgi:hypothetical protein